MLLANVGLPMLVIQWPMMALALVPVIVLEAVLVRDLLDLPFWAAMAGMAKANLLSTLVGIPLAWIAALILEFGALFPLEIAAQHWRWDVQSPALQIAVVILGPGSSRAPWRCSWSRAFSPRYGSNAGRACVRGRRRIRSA